MRYEYTISTGTANGVLDYDKLQYELQQSNLSSFSGLAYTALNSDTIYVDFNSNLSGADKSALDSLVLAHDGTTPLPNGTVVYKNSVFNTKSSRLLINKYEYRDECSTTSTQFNNILNETTDYLRDGNYEIEVSYLWNANTTSRDIIVKLLIDGTHIDNDITNEIHRQEAKESGGVFGGTGTNQKLCYSHTFSYSVDELSQGTKDIELQLASEQDGVKVSTFLTVLKLYYLP